MIYKYNIFLLLIILNELFLVYIRLCSIRCEFSALQKIEPILPKHRTTDPFYQNNDPENPANVSSPFLPTTSIIHPRQIDKSMMAKIYNTIVYRSTSIEFWHHCATSITILKNIASMVCV